MADGFRIIIKSVCWLFISSHSFCKWVVDSKWRWGGSGLLKTKAWRSGFPLQWIFVYYFMSNLHAIMWKKKTCHGTGRAHSSWHPLGFGKKRSLAICFQGNWRSKMCVAHLISNPYRVSSSDAFCLSCDKSAFVVTRWDIVVQLGMKKTSGFEDMSTSSGVYVWLPAFAQRWPACLLTLIYSASVSVSVPLSTSNALSTLLWSSGSVKAFESPHIINFLLIPDSPGGCNSGISSE